jgi:hypothetical protein
MPSINRSKNAAEERVLVSYLTLRRVVGTLGVLLPVVLALGNALLSAEGGLKESISDYYDSPMRDVFVGVLFAIGWFLFSYRGYERKDDIAGNLACVFALGVALFPTTSGNAAVRTVHLGSAAALFTVLAFFSLFLFTKGRAGATPSPEKRMRNRIYVVCGGIMLGAVAGIALVSTLGGPGLVRLNPVFWLESLALWAFGFSWFVKGRTFWRDRLAPVDQHA